MSVSAPASMPAITGNAIASTRMIFWDCWMISLENILLESMFPCSD